VFTTEPVLAISDIDREMRVEADASDYATGGVLSLKYEDGKWSGGLHLKVVKRYRAKLRNL